MQVVLRAPVFFMQLWNKVDCVILRSFKDYWKDPLINKFLGKEASEEYEGILIFYKNKKPTWISHPFNFEQAKKEFGKTAIVNNYSTTKEIEKLIKENTGKRIGYNPRHQTVASFKTLKKLCRGKKLIDVEKELGELREVKEKEEIKRISLAVKQTKKTLAHAIKYLKTGVTEKEIEKLIRDKISSDGFETAFCIVAFGENTANIHHAPTEKKLAAGPVMIDLGAKHKGYNADITETFYFGKGQNPFEEKKFEKEKKKVIQCIKEVEGLLKPGTSANELWKTTKILGKFPHALGHGIGIEVHDFPGGIGEASKFVLKEGMVLAIEPAVYNKKFGIRIENDYLITKKGFKKLD